ncbi:uncharacterized protein [Aegilops tauschii subsp. strangulata]|uniref:uncharacterized protein n=1 Tax=Aegilops tauschii subsp. strangulata TaxID=200361 RepID=UPI003CC86FC2
MVAVFAVVTTPSWALPVLDSTGVFERCVEQDKGIEILLNIHQGECGHHAASRSLVAKVFHHGFYWPMALEDAESLVLKCEGCQRISKRSHQPASALRTSPIAWPFAVWGLDMVGPFKTARGGMTPRPIKKLDGPTAVRLIKDIAVRYGMPNSIITDNDTTFAKGALAQYCSVSGIRLDLASVAHPQSNGQVERANGLILPGIKSRLVEPLIRSPGSWLDELLAVLWKAVIPTDVEFEAKEAREDGVDLLEEARLLALSCSAIYQQGLRHSHSKKLKPLTYREGNLVLRLIKEQTGQHKLSPPWEGPFIVSRALCDRSAYYLIDARKSNKRKRDTAIEETTRAWNAELLRPF